MCQISVDLSLLPSLEKSTPGSSAANRATQLPGWERQKVRPLFVLLCDERGEIALRWKIELVIVDHAVTDAFNKSVEIILAPSVQNKVFGLHRQFYSSNCRRLPCYRKRQMTGAHTDSEEPSPKFALARGFSSPALLLLVTQKQTPQVDGNPHGMFFCDARLVGDDALSVRFFRVMSAIETVLADLRKANFSGADLRGSEVDGLINGANFSGANLVGVRGLGDEGLRRVNFSGADLTGVFLQDRVVIKVNFSNANLTAANISGLNLSGLDFTGANLSDAQLSGANFSRAKLINANLSGADIRDGADLSFADLTGAILDGADLTGAILTGATMPDGTIHD